MKYATRTTAIRTAVATALALAGSGAALAAESSLLEEVVVTATKREQSAQDVGVSVTAFSGEQIRELGFTNTTDIVKMTPGLNYTVPNAESSQINFFLRGVGLNDFADASENPVAVYVDDVYHPAMGGLSFQLFDTERVEVLRGPQGTLFGRNTTGGLIHFVSRKPTDTLDGYLELTGAQYGQIKTEGAIGGPISDKVMGRFSFATNKHDGYVENRFAGAPDYNSTDSKAVRGQLLVKPSDTFDVLFAAYWSKNDAVVGAWQHQSTKLGGATGDVSLPLGPNETDASVDCNADGVLDANDARVGTDCFGYVDTDGDPWAGEFDRNGRVYVKNTGGQITLNWDFGAAKLTSISAVQNVDRLQTEDTEASPFPLIEPTFAAETDTFTQELRLAGTGAGPFRWLAGLYYFDNEVKGKYRLNLTNLGFVDFDARYTQDSKSWAGFGQVEYDLAPTLTLIAGARWSNEKKELDYLNRDTSGFVTGVVGLPSDVVFDFSPASVGSLAKHDDNAVNFRLGLDWKPMDDVLVYGSIARGTKSAGFNVGFLDSTFLFASNTVDTIPFGEEKLTSYEVGFKSTFNDGRTRLNGAVFYYDYEDFQTFRFELLNQIIFNTSAKVKGGELELQTALGEGWTVALAASVLDAKADDIPSPSGVLRQRDMVAAPRFAGSALVRYAFPAFGGTIALQGTANIQDHIYYDIQNVPVSLENGYVVGNVRASYVPDSGRWELAAFVNNVGNEEYLSYTFDFTKSFGFNQQAYGQPRWAGASFRYNFK
jgi:iron complex outermembrane receptor protein